MSKINTFLIDNEFAQSEYEAAILSARRDCLQTLATSSRLMGKMTDAQAFQEQANKMETKIFHRDSFVSIGLQVSAV